MDWWYAACPQNPEILFSDQVIEELLDRQTNIPPTPRPDIPLLCANPVSPNLPSDEDDRAPLSFEYISEIPLQPPSGILKSRRSGGEIWWSRDKDKLRRFLATPPTGDVAGRPLAHLSIWEATCGGAGFMQLGMQPCWTDPVESPKRLRALRRRPSYKFDRDQKRKFKKLLDEDIRQGIVVPVPPDYPAYLFIVPKPNNKWRTNTSAWRAPKRCRERCARGTSGRKGT
jgi:hypothetical protein